MALGLHPDDVITSVRGAVFVAPAETLITTALLKTITTEVDSVGTGQTAFQNLGHMAEDSLPELATDGGDATVSNTWNTKGFRTTYSDTTATLTLHSVQGDKDLLTLVYGGVAVNGGGVDYGIEKKPVSKSVFVLVHDTNTDKKQGLLLPNCDLTFDQLPTFNQDGFNQYDILCTVKPSASLSKSNGKASYVRQFVAADFATGLAA